jgi:transcription elongation GreA/GreB family factor
MHLARVLSGDRRGNAVHNRLLGRLTSLMVGKRGFLEQVLKTIGRDDIASYLGITERGGDDFPQEIIDIVVRVVGKRFPDLTARPERPFWERDEVLFTTRDGLRRAKEDYRLLVEEKIPANSKAIGAAASLGDLSENSEWESAMEEQRTLTTRATQMDREIRSARLIEDQELPIDLVAPGTTVTFSEAATGRERSYRILGPWDVVDEQTVNYRAPIAQGLLGRRIGDAAEVPSPQGPIAVRIEAIERCI